MKVNEHTLIYNLTSPLNALVADNIVARTVPVSMCFLFYGGGFYYPPSRTFPPLLLG